MTAEVIAFPVREGSGAREALIAMLESWPDVKNAEGMADVVLTLLWYRGFKIVPLEDGDCG
jgi:hypothetical protein